MNYNVFKMYDNGYVIGYHYMGSMNSIKKGDIILDNIEICDILEDNEKHVLITDNLDNYICLKQK